VGSLGPGNRMELRALLSDPRQPGNRSGNDATASSLNSCSHRHYGGALVGATDRAESTCAPRIPPHPRTPPATASCRSRLARAPDHLRQTPDRSGQPTPQQGNSAAGTNNAVTGSKPTDGSCGTDTFGYRCNEPAVVDTLHRSASLLQVARDVATNTCSIRTAGGRRSVPADIFSV
jgi:hypothetical protein